MHAPPKGLSPREFEDFIREEFAARYRKTLQGSTKCKTCGDETQEQTLHISCHAAEFGDSCVGSGEVKTMMVPGCPQCEKTFTADMLACVHVYPLEEFEPPLLCPRGVYMS